ncbi:hypothetical protein [Rugosimonospora acidiphila]
MSKPETFQDTAMVKLGASAQVLGTAGGLFGSGANLTNQLSGRAQTAQNSQATQLISQGAQLTSGVTQTANMINSQGQTMKAAKARLVSLVTLAKSQGFLVDLNTGVVTPGPAMLKPTVDSAYYIAQAAKFNEQIQTVVFQVNAQDITVKLSLAKTALDVVSFVVGAAQGTSATTTDPNLAPVPPAGTLPTGTLPTSGSSSTSTLPTSGSPSTGTLPTSGSLSTSASIPTSGLANVSATVGAGHATQLSGATPSFGLASAGQLGVDPMGGAAQGLGASGITPLGGGTAAAGVSALSGANQAPIAAGPALIGQSTTGGGSVMGVGGAPTGAGGRAGGQQRESTAWRQLSEDDEDVWAAGDIPDTNDGVLA